MFTSQNAAVAASSAGTFAKDQAVELTQLASNGDFSIRILALLGAIAMVVVSVIGFLGKILTLHFVSALIEVYVFALAIVIIILESAGKIPLPRSFETNVHKYALFLKFVWGRGILYFIGGSLQVSQVSYSHCRFLSQERFMPLFFAYHAITGQHFGPCSGTFHVLCWDSLHDCWSFHF